MGPRSGARRPLQQGSLDGLCGVYSIVNAMRLVCRKMNLEAAEELFGFLMKSTDSQCWEMRRAARSGLSSRQLSRLVERAAIYMHRKFGIRISIIRANYRRQRGESLSRLWAILGREICKGSVALIGLFGRQDHWTVGTAISAKRIDLFDSDGMRTLLRSSCTTRPSRTQYGLSGRDIFFIGREA